MVDAVSLREVTLTIQTRSILELGRVRLGECLQVQYPSPFAPGSTYLWIDRASVNENVRLIEATSVDV